MKTNVMERLKVSESLSNFIAKNLIDAVWLLDVHTMKYIFVKQDIKLPGGAGSKPPKEFSVREFLTRESYDKALAYLTDALNKYNAGQKVKKNMELEMLARDGSTFWVEISARLLREEDGQFKVIGIARDINQQKNEEQKKEKLIIQLKEAIAERDRLLRENKVLRGLLPICAGCKKIRDEEGRWWPVEEYIASRTEADFTHTICPDCRERLYPDLKSK